MQQLHSVRRPDADGSVQQGCLMSSRTAHWWEGLMWHAYVAATLLLQSRVPRSGVKNVSHSLWIL